MTDVNLQLFDDDHADFGLFIDALDKVVDIESLQKNWPKLVSDFVDLFCAELQRQGITKDKAILMSAKLVAVLGHYFGGRVCYIPTGERLKQAVRDNRLFLDYQVSNGDISALAKKYDLTDSHVYFIIREQLAFHRKRYQPDLFGDKK